MKSENWICPDCKADLKVYMSGLIGQRNHAKAYCLKDWRRRRKHR